jgi:hypothetical protein
MPLLSKDIISLYPFARKRVWEMTGWRPDRRRKRRRAELERGDNASLSCLKWLSNDK